MIKVFRFCRYLVSISIISSFSMVWSEEPNFDFLDKIENIQIPSQGKEDQDSKKSTSSVKQSINGNNNPTIQSAKPTPVPKTKQQTQKPATSITTTNTSPPQDNKKNQPTLPQKATSLVPQEIPTEKKEQERTLEPDEIISVKEIRDIWLDDSLELEPNYILGFSEPNINKEKELIQAPSFVEQTIPPDTVQATVSSVSIWKKFTEFFSQYQKAFYILGILLLFAIYRLKSGRGYSSSKKPVTTIRKIRR